MRPEPLNRPTVTIDRPERSHWGLIASLLLHGLLGAALLTILPKALEDAVVVEEIEVEIIPPSALPAFDLPAAQDKPNGALPIDPLDLPKEEAAAAEARRLQSGGGMIRPERLLSRSLLEAPENAEGRAAYKSMGREEQRDQLCNLEVLEQIKALGKGYVPQWMNAFVFRPVVYQGNRQIANGAAFFSKDKWVRVKFECELSDDGKKIVDFAFQIGVIVPRDDWEQYGLTPVNGLHEGH